MKSREKGKKREREIVFKLSLIKAIVEREAPLINFSSFDTALFSPLRRETGSRRNTNVAGRDRRSRERNERNGAATRERSRWRTAKAEVACGQPVKCGQPVMIVRAWPMVAAIFHRELSTYYVSRTQRSRRVCRAGSPPPTLLFRVRPLVSLSPPSLSSSFLSFSFLSPFLAAPAFLPAARGARRSKSRGILIKRVTHLEPDIHVPAVNGSLVISRTHIVSFIITGPRLRR